MHIDTISSGVKCSLDVGIGVNNFRKLLFPELLLLSLLLLLPKPP